MWSLVARRLNKVFLLGAAGEPVPPASDAASLGVWCPLAFVAEVNVVCAVFTSLPAHSVVSPLTVCADCAHVGRKYVVQQLRAEVAQHCRQVEVAFVHCPGRVGFPLSEAVDALAAQARMLWQVSQCVVILPFEAPQAPNSCPSPVTLFLQTLSGGRIICRLLKFKQLEKQGQETFSTVLRHLAVFSICTWLQQI